MSHISDLDTPIIWVVDENQRELKTTVRVLSKQINARQLDLAIEPLLAMPHKDDYLSLIQDPKTVALILDQKLQGLKGIDHTGIQLAIHLRQITDKLPIYILTGFTSLDGEPNDEFAGAEWSVEDILNKELLQKKKEDQLKIFIDRLVRRINVYQSIVDNITQRFQNLLLKSLEANLSPEEQMELNELTLKRFGTMALTDNIQQKHMTKLINKLDRLEKLLRDDTEDDI